MAANAAYEVAHMEYLRELYPEEQLLTPQEEWLMRLREVDLRYKTQEEKVREVREVLAAVKGDLEAAELERRRVYEEYLNSYEWQAKRMLVLERDHWTCQGCLSAKSRTCSSSHLR